MKAIDTWQDLRPYGIDILTGEACGYGMRYLCDLTEPGCRLVRELFGLRGDSPLGEPWNSRGVASAMIPYGLLGQLAAFALLSDGACAVLVLKGGGAVGYYPGDAPGRWQDLVDHHRRAGSLERTFSPTGGPRVGSRMVHQASGRAT